MMVLKAIVLGLKDAVMDVFFFPVVLLRLVGRGIRFVLRSIHRGFFSILHSPVSAYRKVLLGRDWLLAKVEYLQTESAKWKTTFSILKAPYSLLRSMGFSPQMAASLLMASTAVGGGVVVNETLLSERSFANGDSGTYNAPADVPTSYVEGSVFTPPIHGILTPDGGVPAHGIDSRRWWGGRQ